MHNRILQTTVLVAALVAGVVAGVSATRNTAQAPAPTPGSGRAAPPAPDPARSAKVEILEGTVARYKVREQLAGISFPSDAVGTTTAITGTIVINPDATIDLTQSKITVDLKTIKSDQSMRDGYVQNNTLEVAKFPTLTFVPRRVVGLKLPPASQAGFQLIGDMTLHGVTKEITWNVVSTFGNDAVAGRATTSFTFDTFNLKKPSLARLLSVDDRIELEIEFRSKRTTL